MKIHLINLILVLLVSNGLKAQFHNLTVNGGYGSGSYQVGDTVHIWCEAYDDTKTFSTWNGDSPFLTNPNEWHTTLVMPNQDVTVTSQIANMPAYNINYEQIMGADNLKNVYSFFPPNPKGLLYLFHGTSGSASNWITTVEYRSFVNRAIADTFAIIVTEAEEITLNSDLNGDGKLRWQGFPMDTVNGIDYQNIKIITDTFINRGDLSPLVPKFSVGMSNGGSFSAATSYALNYKAGISYCASSVQAIFGVRDNPFAFRMAKFDDNAEVGAEGNYEAWQNDSTLQARGICHDYKIIDKQPIYPERFARIPGVSAATSIAIFNQLASNGQLNSENYALHSDTIKNHILATSALYSSLAGLTNEQRLEVLSQISASNAEHKFYSDYNFESLDFLNRLCSQTSSLVDEGAENILIKIYPNPSNRLVNIFVPETNYSLEIIDQIGRTIWTKSNIIDQVVIDLSDFQNGIYVAKINFSNGESKMKKLIKE
jgi:hypothetical protein